MEEDALILQFDPQYNVLVDQMGLLLPAGTVQWLQARLATHLQHSTLELEAIGRRTVEERCPGMVNQFDFDYFNK